MIIFLLTSKEVPLKTMKTVCIAHPPSVKQISDRIEDIVIEEENRKGNGVDALLRLVNCSNFVLPNLNCTQ